MKILLILCGLLFFSLETQARNNCTHAADQTKFFNFDSSCRRHDVCYMEQLPSKRSRYRCDVMFKDDMYATCGPFDFSCRHAQVIYYNAARSFGKSGWDKGLGTSKYIMYKLENNNNNNQIIKDMMYRLVAKRFNEQDQWIQLASHCGSLKRKYKRHKHPYYRKKYKKYWRRCTYALNSHIVRNIPSSLIYPNYLGNKWSR